MTSLGARGCVARGAGGEVGAAPACRVVVQDTIGAGDFFTAGFLSAYLQVGRTVWGAVLSVTVRRCAVGMIIATLPVVAYLHVGWSSWRCAMQSRPRSHRSPKACTSHSR